MPSTRSSRPGSVATMLLLLAAFGAWLQLRPSSETSSAPAACAPGEETCERTSLDQAPSRGDAPSSTVPAATFCVNVGYLCADLASEGSVHLRRWKGFDGTVVVYVPLPDLDDVGSARELQRAVVMGLRAWNNQPFPILAETVRNQEPHFAVRWTRSMGGNRLGVARTQWSAASGLSVVEIEMATQNPFDAGRTNDPGQVRLTAAHEMGHALGLGHSDRERDVMYPTNTATSMSANDYRSIEVLYSVPDGTTIMR